eukprot:gene8396-9877_t
MSWSTFHFAKAEPDTRAGHTSTYVPSNGLVGAKMVLIGGNHSNKYLNSVHVLEFPRAQTDTIRWSKPAIRGVGPSPRTGHTASYLKDLRSVLVFGGYDGKRSLNDIFLLNCDTWTWTQIRPQGISPSPRNGHTAVTVNRFLVIHGGCNETNFLNDVHVFDIEHSSWMVQPSVAGLTLFTRFHHTSNLLDSGEMIVYGGCSSGVLYSDMCVLDLKMIMMSQRPPDVVVEHTSPVMGSIPAAAPMSPTGGATPSMTETMMVDHKSHPKYLESQLANALSLLLSEQKQKTLLSNELAQSKEAQTSAFQNVVEEQSKYETLERELSKIESNLKKEQSQKVKAQEAINKLNGSLKEKDNIIQSLHQVLYQVKVGFTEKPALMASPPLKELSDILNQIEPSTFDKQKSIKTENFINKALEVQISDLKREKETLQKLLYEEQTNTLEHNQLQSILSSKLGTNTIRAIHILGESLHDLQMSDLDKLEEIHHNSLRSVVSAKLIALQIPTLQFYH